MFLKEPKLAVWCAFGASTLLLASCAHNQSAENSIIAQAGLINVNGVATGSAKIEQSAANTQLSVRVSGLKPGAYAMHLHQTGKCDPPGFTTAGPHWNPAGKQHGLANAQGPHAGDLPNFNAESDGSANIVFDLPGVTLSSGLQPLLDADGAAILIHAQPDDNITDPSGNSGARIMCGVFALAGS